MSDVSEWIQRTAVVGLDITPWRGRWLNRQQILSRLARRGWQILYSTGPLNWWDRHTQEWKNAPLLQQSVECDGVVLDIAGKLPSMWPRIAKYNDFAIRYHASKLRDKASKELTLAHIFHPDFEPLARHIGPTKTIFHIRDDYRSLDNWNRDKEAQFVRLCEQADLIIASDIAMTSSVHNEFKPKIRELANGADTASFSRGRQLPEPEDIRGIPHPRIGYAGAMNLKFDWELVYQLATDNEDWHWILVGEIYFSSSTEDMRQSRKLLDLPNVHWLGVKNHTDIPAYAGHCDVNVMPYRTSGEKGVWARSGSPLKLHEYLATGLPVIGADIAGIRKFSDVVRIPGNEDKLDAWNAAIYSALHDDQPDMPLVRQRVAEKHSWENRVDKIEEWYLEVLSK